MGGFEVSEGYWLPRGNVKVPSELEQLVWPWIEGAELYVAGYDDEEDEAGMSMEHPTAMEFLRLLKFLRRIFIQDMAAMLCILDTPTADARASQRLSHDLFKRFPLFSSPLFTDYTAKMKEQLQLANRVDKDPNTRRIDQCLPGINKRFDILGNSMARIERSMEDVHTRMEDDMFTTADNFHQLEIRINHEAKKRQIAFTDALGSFFHRGISERTMDLQTYATNLAQSPHNNNGLSPNGISPSPNNEIPVAPDMGTTDTQTLPLDILTAEVPSPHNGNEATMQQQPLPDNTAPTRNNEPDDATDELTRVSNKVMSFRFIGNNSSLCLAEIYQEFFGLGEFQGIPVDGGFFALEQQYKTKWRSGYSPSEKNFFSRAQALVKGVAAKVQVNDGVWNSVVEEQCQLWDQYVKQKGVSGALRYLQSTGEIRTKGKRKRDIVN